MVLLAENTTGAMHTNSAAPVAAHVHSDVRVGLSASLR